MYIPLSRILNPYQWLIFYLASEPRNFKVLDYLYMQPHFCTVGTISGWNYTGDSFVNPLPNYY